MNYPNVALVHLAATGFMCGLIWTIHVVHYPLFPLVNEPYQPFQEEHMRRITMVLAAPWAIESLTGASLVLLAPPGWPRVLAAVGLVFTVVIVGVTGLGAAPIHGRMIEQFDAELHRRLMRIDLVRSLLWTGRLGVAGVLMAQAVSSGSSS